tara:strand:+ start:2732 stop:3262 length:531 start_codon:yes stop_codon:yes gene_type:complete
MLNHLSSKKHIKEMEKEKTDDDIVCRFCGDFFTKEGYELHIKRNKMWCSINPNNKCNVFIYNNQRYSSYESVVNQFNKIEESKERRKENRRKQKPTTIKPSYSINTTNNDDDSYDDDDSDIGIYEFENFCELCANPINDEGYDEKEIDRRGIKICDCEYESDDELPIEKNLSMKIH